MQEGGGKWGDAAVHTRRRGSPCNEKIQAWECAGRRGRGGDRRHSSVFIAPLSPPQRRNPPATRKASTERRTLLPMLVARANGRDNVEVVDRASWGGAPAGAQSYWQGRFAACAFVDDFLGIGRPWNCWGVAPNPTRGAASGLRKGHCPLTLFWLPGLSALPLLLYTLRFQALLALV